MSGTAKRVLWIDDEIEYLRAHVAFLETRGYAVSTASGGDEGIGILRGGAFDLVLLDKQMPVKSGAATLDEIKAGWPGLPVIILTGYQHAADVAMDKKYNEYLTKPVDPDELLGACKRAIESNEHASRKLTDRYMRDYTENKARLGGVLSAAGWMNLHTSLSRWDLEMDYAANEGIRQMHMGLKSDSGKKFCACVIDNYAGWASGSSGRPFMSVDVLEKVVAPELRKGRGVLVVSLTGLSMPQFLAIEAEIKRNFSVTATRFMPVLPTTPNFCLPALAAGLYPCAVSEREPGVFGNGSGACDTVAMKRLMRGGLERLGLDGVKAHYASLDGVNGKRHLRAAIDIIKKAQTYGVLTLDAVEKFTSPAPDAVLPNDVPVDSAEFRRMAEFWFAASDTLAMMREVCGDSRTVILTSAHGHTRCGRAADVYEVDSIGSLRSMFGARVSVDEREVFLLEELPYFKLPAFAPGAKCLMALENYGFALPARSEGGKKHRVDGFHYGGISLDEMILPLYICRPFGSERSGG